MEEFIQNLRYGFRTLRRSPGFTIVAALTLALGVGANTTIFSVVNSVFLSPLPFPDSDRLVRVYSTIEGQLIGPSQLDVQDFAAQNRTLEGLVTFDGWRKNVSGIGGSNEAEEMVVGLAAPEYFQTLGIRPLMGRIFTPEENHYGRHYVALVSETFWRNRLGAEKNVLGQTLRINDEPYTIIGVLPDLVPEWITGRTIYVWTPAEHTPPRADTEAMRQARGWLTFARLKPGVTIDQAQADLDRVASNLAQQHPLNRGVGVSLRPLSETRIAGLESTLWLLMGAVTAILLIACSNIANLLLARNTARQRELALRSALGASRSRLVRQLVAEALVLSCLGSILGLLIAWLGTMAIVRLHPLGFPQLSATSINWRVLLFTLAISVLTGFLFGLLPAFTSTRVSLVEALKEGAHTGTVGEHRQRIRRLIVITEMAFSLMLVIGAALLVKSIVRLQGQETGFQQDHLLKAHLFLPQVRYPNSARITQFCRELGDRLRSTPGIQQATITTAYPPSNRWTENFTIEGRPADRLQKMPVARFILADAYYRQTLAIPLLRGRDLSDSDPENGPPSVLVNEEFAHQYFANEDLLGRQIRLVASDELGPANVAAPLTIVGVIGNTKNRGLALPPEPEIVGLYRQMPPLNFGFKDLVVRTASAPYDMAGIVRRELQQLDADIPFAEVATMDDVLTGQTRNPRFNASLFGLFAALGFTLAVIGVYGVISYLVAQRTHEIGIRIALGAQRWDILWLVLRQGLSMAIVGMAFGLYGGWQMGKAMRSMLWGVTPADPLVLICAALGLVIVSALASAIPGSRAMRTDPLVALRTS